MTPYSPRRLPGFSRVRTAREFQDAVPISTPDSVLADIEALKAGAPRVLTREPVSRFEPSGGSSGASKYVPVTRGLLDEFHRALAPMLFDLLHARPAVREGPSYWSISPIGRKQGRTAGGIPVGSMEDSAYFPRFLQPLLSRVFAVPGAVARLPDVETCRYVTLWFLVASEELALLSVWNPSFLTLLMDALERHGERLAEDLERGVCRPPRGLAVGRTGTGTLTPTLSRGERDGVDAVLSRMRFSPRPERARVLREALRSGLQGRCSGPGSRCSACGPMPRPRTPWPPPAAASRASRSRARACSPPRASSRLPLFGAPAPVLAVRSHFFEFLDPEHPECPPPARA